MIFITVGTDMPFDRMMRAVDDWAMRRGRRDLLAQTGNGAWQPRWMNHTPRLTPAEYRRMMAGASLAVSHAGMGTILSALTEGTPLIVLPKRACLGEHRNDHQVHTARRFSAMGLIAAAEDEQQLIRLLDFAEQFPRPQRIGRFASPQLIGTIRSFINEY